LYLSALQLCNAYTFSMLPMHQQSSLSSDQDLYPIAARREIR
jgi:hypothetical protein